MERIFKLPIAIGMNILLLFTSSLLYASRRRSNLCGTLRLLCALCGNIFSPRSNTVKFQFLFIVLILLHPVIFAQEKSKIDSLQTLVADETAHDTTRVNTLLELANEYYLSTPSKAIEYCNKAKEISEKVNYKKGISESYGWLGYLYEQKGQIKEALEYNQRCLSIKEEIGDKKGIATSLINIGSIYLTEKNYSLALVYADSSLILAKELGYPENIRNAAKLFADIYKVTRNYEKGWEMYELYVLMRDSVQNKENEKAAIRQHTKYEFEKELIIQKQKDEEKRRQEAAAIDRRNFLQNILILIGLLIVFGVVLAIGYVKVNEFTAKIIIFFATLMLFEFIVILADPYIEAWTGGAPAWKLLFNSLVAAGIYPEHSLMERKLIKRLVK